MSSLPSAVTKTTEAPARAAATAWFAPLPPPVTRKSPPLTVSPGAGRCGTRTVMSVFVLPTTTTFAT